MNNKAEEKALKILNILYEQGHESYIVGGYVRDKLIGIDSNDIDICTSATPKEIMEIFPNTSSPNYGSVNIIYKNTNFDITTFRRDIKYQDNRLPVKIKYIKKIRKDLLRRDFTINTICIDKDGNIVDYLNAIPDLNNHRIKTVGNPRYRLKEDSLRILRAVRFATILDFDIDSKTENYLTVYAHLLKKLSYQRKKQELDKIFTSTRVEKGIKLLVDLKIAGYLNLSNLDKIVPCDDLIGIWTQLNVDDIYPFTKVEKQQMKNIRELLELDIKDPYNIYKYGLYISTVAYQIKKESIPNLNKVFKELPIQEPKDLKITKQEIASILNKEPGEYLKEIVSNLEKAVLYKKVENTSIELTKYIKNNFK